MWQVHSLCAVSRTALSPLLRRPPRCRFLAVCAGSVASCENALQALAFGTADLHSAALDQLLKTCSLHLNPDIEAAAGLLFEHRIALFQRTIAVSRHTRRQGRQRFSPNFYRLRVLTHRFKAQHCMR